MTRFKVKVIYPNEFKEHNTVKFILGSRKKQIFEGLIYSINKKYYIKFGEGNLNNKIIFDKLKISDPTKFTSVVLQDSKLHNGVWPMVDTLDQLKKVCKALEYYDEF